VGVSSTETQMSYAWILCALRAGSEFKRHLRISLSGYVPREFRVFFEELLAG